MIPEVSLPVQAFIRSGYGVLMALTLLQALPEARRFFVSERWGGYAKSSPAVDAVQNPMVLPFVLLLWFAVVLGLITGHYSPWPALVNLVLCRYLFIHMRWKGILRGMGAPGFIAYWLGGAVFLLEYCARFAPEVRGVALLVCQVDLAFIMLSAGIYKMTAGYPRNHGMELGLCNPMWGYWWRWYARLAPNHALFWTLNQLAWGTEVVAAILMILPATREVGGLLLGASFIFILTQIRLGFLCEMVALACLLYVVPGGWVTQVISRFASTQSFAPIVAGPALSIVNTALMAGLVAYLVLLPLAHAGLYFTFYARRSLRRPLQQLLDRYTNTFGMIIWRVFSADLVNFFIRIYVQTRDGSPRQLVSHLGRSWRFSHVGEMICLTSLFTTLKYYPTNDALFRERLLRYARTIPRPAGATLVFEYSSVIKRPDRFDWAPVMEYHVDVDAGTLTAHSLDPTFSPHRTHPDSPVHEGALPGSYVPASR